MFKVSSKRLNLSLKRKTLNLKKKKEKKNKTHFKCYPKVAKISNTKTKNSYA